MKEQIRVLAIDDGPFTFEDSNVDILGVLTRGSSYIEAVLRDEVGVDGTDSTERIIRMISNSKYLEQVGLVLLDGGAFGGFNIFDIHVIRDELEVPVITVTRKSPDFNAIRKALKRHFEDWGSRFETLSKGDIEEVVINNIPVYVKLAGISLNDAESVLRRLTVQGTIPEPLRLAHIIATILKKRVYSGKV